MVWMTLLSVIPILSLLIGLLVLKLPAGRAGAISLLFALAIAYTQFGIDLSGLTVTIGKGLSLGLYILLIIWGAMFLYHLVDDFGAIDVINKNIVIFVQDRFVQFLLLAWLFSAILQGIAGFGVPVIIVTPILMALGFDPAVSAAAALLGHSWAVSFGSMGSSFFTMFLVTGIPQDQIGVAMWMFDTLALVLTGLAVCFLYGGIKQVAKGLVYVLPTGAVMSAVMIATVKLGLFSLISLNTGLAGIVTLFCIYRRKAKQGGGPRLYASKLTLFQATAPYVIIFGLTLVLSFLKLPDLSLSFRFPGFITALGHVVSPEAAYAKIRLLGHPAPIILIAATVGILVYKRAGVWDVEVFRKTLKKTAAKCVPTSLSLVCLVTMALIMMDSGMTNQLAQSVAAVSGRLYPLFAPFFGVLGSFITGSNTNSNVLFGKFQYTIAQSLGVSGILMCGVQSISGSVGVSIGPTTVLMGASAARLVGQESLVYKKVLVPTLLIAALLGIANYILLEILHVTVGGL